MTTPLDNLLAQLGRWDSDWDSFVAGSPWQSGVRSVRQGTYPPLNVGSSPDSIDVYLFAGGLDAKSLDLSLQQNLLTISGERTEKNEEDGQKDVTYYRRERFNGTFQRVLTLPEDVDPDKVDASYKDGVLHVRMGRREEVKPKRIEVK
ncbi:MAG: Hsp20/alpha crystallin family protein [Pseudomonadales bacterium]